MYYEIETVIMMIPSWICARVEAHRHDISFCIFELSNKFGVLK